MSLKNAVTPPGIDPGTVRLVAQRLKHYATPGPTESHMALVISFLLLVLFTRFIHDIKKRRAVSS
jgi:hypothetical protein